MRAKVQSLYFAIAAGAAASLCIVAATAPAAARGVPTPLTVAPTVSSGSPAAEKKICVKAEPLTGTRIARDECRTRAEWEAGGYTVTTRAKKKDAKR